MYILLNAVSKNWIILLLNEKKEIILDKEFSILWEESSKIGDMFLDFLKNNKINIEDIKNIIVVNWPWSFTWIRTITLFVNTLAFIYKNINLTEVSFFSLFTDYPVIKASSKRDLFVKKSKNNIIEILKNEEFLDYVEKNNIDNVYWEEINIIKTNSYINYKEFLKSLTLDTKREINAFYLKKPSIN